MVRDRPDILFVPPLGWLIALVLTWALGRWAPLGILPSSPWLPGRIAGGAIVAFAIYTNVSGALAFKKAGTNINPYKPALAVATAGAFRYTRNPMYLGMILFVLGFGLLTSNIWGVICAAALWAALHYGVVLREERYMEAKFGDAYRALLTETRRWL